MHRIDTNQATVNNMFQSGDPIMRTDGTVVDAAWLNAIQEEVVNVILGRGIALTKGVNNQLQQAINSQINQNLDILDIKFNLQKLFPDSTRPWFRMNAPSGIIHSQFNSQFGEYSGWPDLVRELRGISTELPISVDDQGLSDSSEDDTIAEFSFTSVSEGITDPLDRSVSSIRLHLDIGEDYNIRIVNQIAEHLLATNNTFPVISFIENVSFQGVTIPSDTEVHVVGASPGIGAIDISYPSHGLSTINETMDLVDALFSVFPFRIAGSTDQARHYTLAGSALMGAEGLDFSLGLMRRDHFQKWKSLDISGGDRVYINDGGGEGVFIGDPGLNLNQIELGVHEAGAGTPRDGENTNPRGMGVYIYLYGGRKLDS